MPTPGPAVYDDERIRRRSRMIGYAIAARRHRFPDEIPCVYRPFAESGEVFRRTDEVKDNLEDYNRLDLSIWPPPNLPLEPRPASVPNRFTSCSRTTVCLAGHPR